MIFLASPLEQFEILPIIKIPFIFTNSYLILIIGFFFLFIFFFLKINLFQQDYNKLLK